MILYRKVPVLCDHLPNMASNSQIFHSPGLYDYVETNGGNNEAFCSVLCQGNAHSSCPLPCFSNFHVYHVPRSRLVQTLNHKQHDIRPYMYSFHLYTANGVLSVPAVLMSGLHFEPVLKNCLVVWPATKGWS